MSRARSLLLSMLLALVLPTGAAGQEVRGRLSDAASRAPLAGAYVTLRDADGAVVASTLTNQAGWFSLTAPRAGRWEVLAEYIGYEAASVQVSAVAGTTAWVELATAFRAIELEGLVAEVDRACDVDPGAAGRVARLWDEVRKALQATRFVEERGALLFEVERWTRSLEPRRLRVTSERRRPGAGLFPGSPFVSLPPEDLAREGYIREVGEDGELAYYAPDAQVLLSSSFQAAHCFGFAPRGPEEGWVGLTFRPRDRRAADVEGTLWIHASTYEPLRLDYRYPVLPWSLVTDAVGGRIRFARIPEGPWIVRRWWVRMPVVQATSFRMAPDAPVQQRFEIASLLEEGGEVVEARSAEAGAFAFETGSLRGVVRDADSGTPVAGAEVRLRGTILRSATDTEGRFSLPDVPEGRYEVLAVTADLAALGLTAPGTEVDVREGEAARVEVRVPTSFQVLARRCSGDRSPEGAAIVTGTVADATGAPVAGARAVLFRQEVRSLSVEQAGGRQGVRVPQVTAETRGEAWEAATDTDGSFTLCGVPAPGTVTLQATAPGYEGTPVEVRTEAGGVAIHHLELAPETKGEPLQVTVLGPDGRAPVEAADVVLEDGRSAVTDASGTAWFGAVPPGPTALTVRHLAYLPRTDTVRVSDEGATAVTVRLADRAVELEPIVVEVRTPEAMERRVATSNASVSLAQVDIREAIRSARVSNLADVVRDALPSGVRVGPMVRGSNYMGTCIESTRGAIQYFKLNNPGVCRMVQVVVDGMYLGTEEAARLVENFPLTEIVSMEFLSPMEQTFRFGTNQATGMLIIRTARTAR